MRHFSVGLPAGALARIFAACVTSIFLSRNCSVAAPGQILWTYTETNLVARANFYAPVIAQDGTIYLSSGRALDAVRPNGTLLWSHTTPQNEGGFDPLLGRPTIRRDGVVLLPSWESGTGITALDPQTGAVLWSLPGSVYNISAGLRGTFLIEYGYPQQGGANVKVESVDLNGNLIWSSLIKPSVYPESQAVFVGSDGTLYVSSIFADTLDAFTQSGQKLWQRTLLPPLTLSMVDESGILYLQTTDFTKTYVLSPDGLYLRTLPLLSAIQPSGNLFAAKRSDQGAPVQYSSFTPQGELLWSDTATNAISTGQAIASDGTIYSVELSGNQWALRALNSDGSLQFVAPLGSSDQEPGFTAPVIGEDGTIYVTGRTELDAQHQGSILMAIAGNAPLSQHGWPVPGGDAANTHSKEMPLFVKLLEATVSQTGTVVQANVRTLGVTVHTTVEVGESPDALQTLQTLDVFRVPENQTISFTLTNLQPAHTYYYRLIAANGTNQVRTPIASFLSGGPTQAIPVDESALRAATASGGTITFGSGGVIRLTNEIQIVKDAVLDSGGFDVQFEGGSNTRLFSIQNANVTLRGLKLMNVVVEGAPAHPPTNGASIYGGAIFASNATLHVESCVFSNNIVRGGTGAANGPGNQAGGDAFGACIFQDGGMLTISSSTFAACSAVGATGGFFPNDFPPGHDAGGALFVANAKVDIQDSQFESNSVATPASLFQQNEGKGGALFLTNSPAELRGSRFARNSAASGGAIFTESLLTIRTSAFDSNRALGGSYREGGAAGRGGAVFSSAPAGLAISASTLTHNTAQGGDGNLGGLIFPAGDAQGGAIYAWPGTMTLSNCVVGLNAAIGGLGVFAAGGSSETEGGRAEGGGIFCASAVLDYCTIASNSLSSNNVVITGGGALFSTNGVVSFHATVLSQEGENVLASIEDRGYNLVSDIAPQFTNARTRTGIDSRLGPFTIPDGLHGYFVPLPDSPVLDAGDPANYPPVDVRGVARPVGDGPDIGAVEVTPTPTLVVTKNGTNVILQVSLQSAGPAVIEASEDLVHWNAVFTSPLGQTSFEWPVSSPTPSQFYRVRE